MLSKLVCFFLTRRKLPRSFLSKAHLSSYVNNSTWNISVFPDSGSDQEDYYYMNFLESNDTLSIPAKGKTPSSVAESVAIGVFLSIIILISIVGNSLVCVAVFKVRQMRKIGNFYLVSLAIADLLVSLLVMTFALANDIMEEWVFGHSFCSVWISLDIMCSTASILNLCAISLDRYIHIRDPLHYENWMTKKKNRNHHNVSVGVLLSYLIFTYSPRVAQT